jgi:hypothetical protein
MGDTTTPTKDSFHGALPPRGLAGTSSSSFSGGRFGRMFRHLPAAMPSDDSLAKLGQAMIQELEKGALDKPLGDDDDDENTSKLDDGSLRLPAGYTYFGQFVDHDITFDPVSSLTRQNDPDGLNDFRTPRFDLDSLYGRGPADQPYLYEKDGLRLSLGNSLSDDEKAPTAGPDLQRDANGRAIIGDPRNDENLIVSQLQVTFIKFHNTVLKKVESENPKLLPEDRFKLAQREVRWHYQWVVIHDYLRRLVGQDVIDDILPMESYVVPLAKAGIPVPRLRFYSWDEQPYMPVEFSVAAYRFGHSMARPSYEINQVAKADPKIAGVSRIPLFSPNEGERQSLKGFRPPPRDWGVQWRFFLPGIKDGIEADSRLPQPSYKLDAQLSNPLGELPKSTAEAGPIGQGLDPDLARDLAVRNLIRGKSMGLPSGQDISRAMGIEPLSDAELFEKIELNGPAKEDLAGRAPLWFYILKEAEKRADSAHLGPVGGRIVAEVLIGLLAGDPLSFLGVQPDWTPALGEGGDFTLTDLINIAVPAPQTPTPYSG